MSPKRQRRGETMNGQGKTMAHISQCRSSKYMVTKFTQRNFWEPSPKPMSGWLLDSCEFSHDNIGFMNGAWDTTHREELWMTGWMHADTDWQHLPYMTTFSDLPLTLPNRFHRLGKHFSTPAVALFHKTYSYSFIFILQQRYITMTLLQKIRVKHLETYKHE